MFAISEFGVKSVPETFETFALFVFVAKVSNLQCVIQSQLLGSNDVVHIPSNQIFLHRLSISLALQTCNKVFVCEYLKANSRAVLYTVS